MIKAVWVDVVLTVEKNTCCETFWMGTRVHEDNLSKHIPILPTDQMAEVYRLMIEEFQISLVQMMENVGRRSI